MKAYKKAHQTFHYFREAIGWEHYQYLSPNSSAPRSAWINPQVGDGVTYSLFTDCLAHTVIYRSGARIVIQRDKVKRLDRPEFVPGGFAGHCTNQREIRWEYSRNPKGRTETFTRRKNGNWVRKGEKMNTGVRLFMGRHEYYDFNF